MKSLSTRPGRRGVLGAVAVLASAFALTAVPAVALGGTVSIKAKGAYAHRTLTACGHRHNFRLFHRGSTIRLAGYALPPSAGHFAFEVEVKKCSGGSFRPFHKYAGRGKKLTGRYKYLLAARGLAARGRRSSAAYYSMRVRVGTGRSRKVYIAVTR